MLDASGFVRRSQVFAGNVREHHTLAQMLDALNALVVSRERTRHFDADAALSIETASHHRVHLHKVLSDDGQEARLYRWGPPHLAPLQCIPQK